MKYSYKSIATRSGGETLELSGEEDLERNRKMNEVLEQHQEHILPLKYKEKRRKEYPEIGDQLDYIFHHGIDKWKEDMILPVKRKYPKP